MQTTPAAPAQPPEELARLTERIAQLEQQLAQSDHAHSERRYHALTDAIPQLVWATDADGSHIYFNQRWYDYTGLSEADSLGFGFINALHPDDKARTLERWERAWRNRESYEIEYRFRRHDGAYHWFIGRAMPVYGPARRVIEWVGTCTEIDEQRRSRQALSFLAEASALLATSLDYEETLARLARIAVPEIADWCAIDLETEGRIERLAVAHVDPSKVSLAEELHRRWPPDPAAPAGVPAVIRSGKPEVVPVITDEMVRQGVQDPELREITLKLGLRSSMVLPLTARGRTFGAITLVSAESGRYFTEADQSLAEDIARRAAIAIDNAQLYRELSQFRGTLDRTHDCVFMFDAETLRFFYVNQGAVDQVGYSVDELTGMTPLEIKPTFTPESFRAMLAPMLAGELGMHTFETLHRHKDGHDLPVEIALQYVDPPVGKPRFVAVVRDITERKRHEAELARQAAVLNDQARLIDLAREGIIVREPTGRIITWNRGATELYGFEAEQAVGKITHDLLATRLPSGVGLTPPDQEAILGASGFWEGELLHTRHDGQPIIVESRQVAVTDASGQRAQILEINRDVTARKQAELALRASEQRYRALADAMPLLVWIADASGGMISTNRPWELYTGVTLAELGAHSWGQIVHPADLALTTERWTASVSTGQQFEVEQRVRGADGSFRWHLVRALPVRDEAGKLAYWVGTNTDIDRQKQSERMLREQTTTLARLTRQLEERNRELDQFAYITSHDLKAPLRGIANLSQWIEEDLGEHATDGIRQQLELLKGRAHRMEALIDGILQYSRVGRVGDQPQAVALGPLLDDVIDLLAPAPDSVRVEPGMPTIVAERVLLQQVFHNLIGNALKHGGPGVQVRVSCHEQAERYTFTVADNGPGIAPQYHERIFGIFQTLASRDRVEGSGLGLALVKKIVQRQGGQVTIDSDEGRGAAFQFTWPREPTGAP